MPKQHIVFALLLFVAFSLPGSVCQEVAANPDREIISENTTHEGHLTIPGGEIWQIKNCTYTIIAGRLAVKGTLILENATLKYEAPKERAIIYLSTVEGKFIAQNSNIGSKMGFYPIRFASGSKGELTQTAAESVLISERFQEGLKLYISNCQINYLGIRGNQDVEVNLEGENTIDRYELVYTVPRGERFKVLDDEIISGAGSYTLPAVQISPMTKMSRRITSLHVKEGAEAFLEDAYRFSKIDVNGYLEAKNTRLDSISVSRQGYVFLESSRIRYLGCYQSGRAVLVDTEVENERVYHDSLALKIKTIGPDEVSFSLVVGQELSPEKVSYYIDDILAGSSVAAPFEQVINVSAFRKKEHTIEAVVHQKTDKDYKVSATLEFARLAREEEKQLEALSPEQEMVLKKWGSVARYDSQRTGKSPYSGPGRPWLKWLNEDADIPKSSLTVSFDGTIHFTTEEGVLCAVDREGKTKWKVQLGASSHPPAVASDGTIYISTKDGRLLALSPKGEKMWEFAAGDEIFSSPAIDSAGDIYFCSKNGFYCLMPDGTLKWKSALIAGRFSPSIAPDGTIYVFSGSSLYALNKYGNIKWELTDLPGYLDPDLFFFPVGPDGTVYVVLRDGTLCVVSPQGKIKWTFVAWSKIIASPAVSSDGTVYFLTRDKNLYAIAADGNLRWKLPLQWARTLFSPSIDSQGNIYFATERKIYSLSPEGNLRWHYEIGGYYPVSSPVIGPEDTIYFSYKRIMLGRNVPTPAGFLAISSLPQQMVSREREETVEMPWSQFQKDAQHTGRYPYQGISSYFGKERPKLKWMFLGLPTSTPAVAADGSIYFCSSWEGKLFALSRDGKIRWTFKPEEELTYSPSLSPDGTVYVVSVLNLYAVNQDGTLKWECKIGERILTPLTVAPDGTIYFVTRAAKKVFLWAVSPDGNIKWQFDAGPPQLSPAVTSYPAVAADGTIYFGKRGKDGGLYAVNPDGKLKWKLFLQDYAGITGPPSVGPDGTIYVVAEAPYRLIAVSPDGLVKKEFIIDSCAPLALAIGADGTLYMGGAVGWGPPHFYALHPQREVKWQFQVGGGSVPDVVSTSAVIGPDGTIYFGLRARGHRSRIYAFREDGSLKWEYEVHGRKIYGLAIGQDGTLYATSDDGNLYAISSVPDELKLITEVEKMAEAAPSPRQTMRPEQKTILSLKIKDWSVDVDRYNSILRVRFNIPPEGSWKLIDPDENVSDRNISISDRTADFQMAWGTPLPGRYILSGEFLGESTGTFNLDFKGGNIHLLGIKIGSGYAYALLKNTGDVPVHISEIHTREPEGERWTQFFISDGIYVMPGETRLISGDLMGYSGYGQYCPPGTKLEVKLMGKVAGEKMEILRQETIIGTPLTPGEK